MSAPPILQVENLSIHGIHGPLFSDLSFTLAAGEMVAIMGPSGIGKSMLAKAIAGYLPAELNVTGQIYLKGQEISQRTMLQRSAAERPGIIFQDALTALNPLVTIEQQLALALTQRRTRLTSDERQALQQLLLELGFSQPDMALVARPSQLSGGQRQRIGIAMALIGHAPVVIADEPTSALDPITETAILNQLRTSIRRRTIAGVLITHDLSAALACEKIVVIDEGKMVAQGTPMAAIKASNYSFCQRLAQLLPAQSSSSPC
ncbi:MAG: ATP-binding cassette domain-containing protein [Ferrimonas sp.]